MLTLLNSVKKIIYSTLIINKPIFHHINNIYIINWVLINY